MSIIRWGGFAILFLVLLFGLIQIVPYGRDHSNPPVYQEPPWDSSQTQELVSNACYDCHSNETVWPWYSNIAPVSWLIQHDVEEGRSVLNLSEWGRREMEAEEIGEVIHEGEMPPWYYVMLHPKASLSETDKEHLISGMITSIGGEVSVREDGAYENEKYENEEYEDEGYEDRD